MNEAIGYTVKFYDDNDRRQILFCKSQQEVAESIIHDPEGRKFTVFQTFSERDCLRVSNQEVLQWCIHCHPNKPKVGYWSDGES